MLEKSHETELRDTFHDVTNERLFCPILNCPDNDSSKAHGWNTLNCVKAHLYQHTTGRIARSIPTDFLNLHNLSVCGVCYHVISQKFGGICKKCRPESRASISNNLTSETEISNLPSLNEIHLRKIKTLRYVPKGAKYLRTKCLTTTAAHIVQNNSISAWTEFFMLPKSVLCTPSIKGNFHRSLHENFVKSRCTRWLK